MKESSYIRFNVFILSVIILPFLSCKRNKVPDPVFGNIVSFTKNGESRMDTIHKYFQDQMVRFDFVPTQTELLAKIDFPYRCGTAYYINGSWMEMPTSAPGCSTSIWPNMYLSPTKMAWQGYSFGYDRYISFIDGVESCENTVYWEFEKVDKYGHFNLQHTTAGGDVYKLEFR